MFRAIWKKETNVPEICEFEEKETVGAGLVPAQPTVQKQEENILENKKPRVNRGFLTESNLAQNLGLSPVSIDTIYKQNEEGGKRGTLENQKIRLLSGSLAGSDLMQVPGLPSTGIKHNLKSIVKFFGNKFNVEVGGIEPPDPRMVSRGLHQATPTLEGDYQREIKLANEEDRRVGALPPEKTVGAGLVPAQPIIPSRSQEDGAPTRGARTVNNPSPEGKDVIAHSVLEVCCPYCDSKNFVKRGLRQKKREKVQLYFCKDCLKTFTPSWVKGKQHPWNIILNAISYYNLGFSLADTCKIMKEKQNENVQPSTLASWLERHGDLCVYLRRMRSYAIKEFSPYDVIETATLAHRQLYRFRYHRAKIKYALEEDFKNYKLRPLKDLLDLVTSETPHQFFQEGLRASESPIKFSKSDMIVRSKENFATKLAKLTFQGVKDNKQRHEELQKFMIANDTVTVATEVPIYLKKEDLSHMQTQLGFEMYERVKKVHKVCKVHKEKEECRGEVLSPKELVGAGLVPARSIVSADVGANNYSPEGSGDEVKGNRNEKNQAISALGRIISEENLPRIITGHIDFLQIRNGMVHILDYKSHAAKEKPIEQLTLYALALSRMTGLRVFHFKCAWFDEKDYFEFYPLHVVYKKRKNRRRKNITTKEGVYAINRNKLKVESLRPKEVRF